MSENKIQSAIAQIESQLSDLKKITDKGHVDEAAERVDRWYARAKKTIDDCISNAEAQNFRTFRQTTAYADNYDLLTDKIEFYQRKLKVLIEELKTHPESLIDPAKLTVESKDNSPDQMIFKLIHTEISRVSKKKFLDAHYADSVESAFKEVNHRIKLFIKNNHKQEDDGVSLMRLALGGDNPKIDMGASEIDLTKKGMREGYCHIFAGSMQAIRNPKAHENISIDKKRAVHFLFLASLEMYKLDDAKVPIIGELS